jgi:hypothetical protein
VVPLDVQIHTPRSSSPCTPGIGRESELSAATSGFSRSEWGCLRTRPGWQLPAPARWQPERRTIPPTDRNHFASVEFFSSTGGCRPYDYTADDRVPRTDL